MTLTNELRKQLTAVAKKQSLRSWCIENKLDEHRVWRFMSGKDVLLSTAEELCSILNLVLTKRSS